MKGFILLTLLLFIGLSACQNNYVYQEQKEIENAQWAKNNVLNFEIDTATLEAEASYGIGVHLRYHTAIKHKTIKLEVELTEPDGKSQKASYDLNIRNDSGEAIGEEMGDIGDYSQVLLPDFKFAQGKKYQVKVSQVMEGMQELGGIMLVELFVERKQK